MNPPLIQFAGITSDRIIVAAVYSRGASWYTPRLHCVQARHLALYLWLNEAQVATKELKIALCAIGGGYADSDLLGWHPITTVIQPRQGTNVLHFGPGLTNADDATNGIFARQCVIPPLLRAQFIHSGVPASTYLYAATLYVA